VQWFYLDEEDKFDALIESMNPKGLRERKLLENLRKCRDRLKLKKTKKITVVAAPVLAVQNVVEDVQMTTENGDDEQVLNGHHDVDPEQPIEESK